MGVLRGFERRLEGAVEGMFARAFRSGLQPIELAKAVQRYCEDHKHVTSKGVIAPNDYRLVLNPEDNARMETYGSSLHRELGEVVRATCTDKGWQLYGAPTFTLDEDDDILLGRFEITARIRADGTTDAGRHAESTPGAPASQLFGGDRRSTTDERPAVPGPTPGAPAPGAPPRGAAGPAVPGQGNAGFVPPVAIPPAVPPVAPPAPAPGGHATPLDRAPQGDGGTPPTQAMPAARPAPPPTSAGRQGPAASRAAPLHLEVLDTGATMVLRSGRYTIGRSDDCDITIDSTTVSRKHAVLVERGNTWWVFDLGSTNGTRVNGTRASELPIRPGDRVRVGTVDLLVEEV